MGGNCRNCPHCVPEPSEGASGRTRTLEGGKGVQHLSMSNCRDNKKFLSYSGSQPRESVKLIREI